MYDERIGFQDAAGQAPMHVTTCWRGTAEPVVACYLFFVGRGGSAGLGGAIGRRGAAVGQSNEKITGGLDAGFTELFAHNLDSYCSYLPRPVHAIAAA